MSAPELEVVQGDLSEFVAGFKAALLMFSLKSTSKLWTETVLKENDFVQGAFAGPAEGYKSVRDKDGSLAHVQVVQVTDAEITHVNGTRVKP